MPTKVLHAFVRRSEYGDNLGGSVCYGSNGQAFDIGAALAENPTIVTDDESLTGALRDFPGLVETDVPDDAAPVDAAPVTTADPSTVSIDSPVADFHESVPAAEHLDDDLVPDDPEKAGELGSKPAGL
jgi:hypothetical protein